MKLMAIPIPKMYYLPKHSHHSSSNSLNKISSIQQKNCDSAVSVSPSLKKPLHSKSFGSLPNIEREENLKENNVIHKTPKTHTQLDKQNSPSENHHWKNLKISSGDQSSPQKLSESSNSKKSKNLPSQSRIEKVKKQFENSPSLGYLEDDLINEISAINDRIEDLINNQRPLFPSKGLSFKNLKNAIKQQESSPGEVQIVRTPFQKASSRTELAKEKNVPNPLKEDLARMKVFSKWLDLSVYERNNLWAENKIKRIEQQKSQKRQSCLNECTFKPKISHSNSGVSPEKYGTYDINQMKEIFRDTKTYRNTYSNQRTLKKRFNSVNKPINVQ